MSEVDEFTVAGRDPEDAGMEETLLAACAAREGTPRIPESLTERLFFVREQMERIETAPPAGACLLVSGPKYPPQWFSAVDGWTIGRDGQSDLVLRDNRVSRRHARLERDGDNWAVRDLNSQNGLRVNGTAAKEHALRSGDVVEIADFAIIFMD